jgi:hypothetical protein
MTIKDSPEEHPDGCNQVRVDITPEQRAAEYAELDRELAATKRSEKDQPSLAPSDFRADTRR